MIDCSELECGENVAFAGPGGEHHHTAQAGYLTGFQAAQYLQPVHGGKIYSEQNYRGANFRRRTGESGRSGFPIRKSRNAKVPCLHCMTQE